MNEAIEVLLRVMYSIAVLFVFTRILGPKQISQLTFFDCITGISIGSIAAEMAVNTDSVHYLCIIAMAVYSIILLISIITSKSIKLRHFMVGTPKFLIENGKVIKQNF